MNLSIVIPCKNEEDYIGNLLQDLAHQKGIKNTPIIIADANSTDNTLQVIEYYEHLYPYLDITVIKGGNVSFGRNEGAKVSSSKYIAFVDADVRFFSDDTLYTSVKTLETTPTKLITCKLRSYSKDWRSKLAFNLYNFIHYFLIKKYPFAIGAYFFISRKEFEKFNMFNEQSDNSEDFLFSQNFKPKEFKVINHFIGQDDRRFKKMGYFGMGFHLIKNLFYYMKNRNEEFTKKSRYWN